MLRTRSCECLAFWGDCRVNHRWACACWPVPLHRRLRQSDTATKSPTAVLCVLIRVLLLSRRLALESNQLEGAIPLSFGSLAGMASLTVDHNRISDVPQSLLSLASLRSGDELLSDTNVTMVHPC